MQKRKNGYQNHLSFDMNNAYYNQFFEIGQQAVNSNLYKIGLPADAMPNLSLIKAWREQFIFFQFDKVMPSLQEILKSGHNC